MTITDLLKSDEYKFNMSKLARDLNVNRVTLKAYSEDKEGEHHFIVDLQLYANLSTRISVKGCK